jgi:hypothetical protein
MPRVEPRVCPFCGAPPGDGVFCAACGRNLAAVERLPTRSEWEGEEAAAPPLAERCAQATAAFLAAMHAAGDPGATTTPMPKTSPFKRAAKVHGWVVRPVDREDFEGPKRYEPGLVMSVEGDFHRLDNELRGWGQRDFPSFEHTVAPEPVDMPVDERLIGELAAALDANGVRYDFTA